MNNENKKTDEIDIIASTKKEYSQKTPQQNPDNTAQIKRRRVKRDITASSAVSNANKAPLAEKPLSEDNNNTQNTSSAPAEKLITRGSQPPKLSEKILSNAENNSKTVAKKEADPVSLATPSSAEKNSDQSLKQTLHDIYGDDNSNKKIDRPKNKSIDEKDDDFHPGSAVIITKTIFKVAAYIIFVLAASAILSYYGISIANDVFAFVKDDTNYTLTLEDNVTVEDIAQLLYKNDAIDYPSVFEVYVKFKNRNSEKDVQFEPGEYEMTTNLNYDEIIYKLKKKVIRETVWITIPEGLTADQIIDIFLEKGIGTREGFEAAIASSLNYTQDYEFLKQLQKLETTGFEDGRKYALEGYLFPDTYEFYTDSSEKAIIGKLLETFNIRFDESYYERIKEMNVTIDYIVNLASIVQMETKYESEFLTVASVYANRLKNPTAFPRLECDSTYLYAFPDRRSELTLEEMKQSDNPYSTYSNDGLPPSAICNPGINAIIAALYPDATDSSGKTHTYYYMVARKNGYHYFSSTAAEHAAATQAARSEE